MSKPKILIVDDSQLNRELLACMLEDNYGICEAENGEQAVEILERCHKDFKLVLLDLIMPVMDGYQVLAVMKAKQWLDMLPVICISSETSGDSIRRVYRLGASDYFSRPFDAMTVFHRVESTIALHDKMTGDLQDAMKMLSSIFHRILKINLSTDTYTVIRGKDSIVSMPSSLSESLKMMADLKYIYEEDQEEYLKFCSMDNLRRELAKGRERISLNYRTLIKQEYRWVCMEVIRSAEYKPDDQIAMMYIRDINDEYLKQLDKIIRHAKDAFASVTVNISDGSCIMANSRIASLELKDVNEPLDSYIERISQSIPQREVRTQYRKVFCVDNLRECLAQGKDMIQWECPVYAAKGISLRMIRTTVEMVRNVSYDRLEALIYFSDITENYFSEQIPHMLYRKNFDRIEIIDGQRDCVRLDHPGICAMEMVLAEEISYSGYVTEVMKRFVPDDEKSVYDKCVRLDTIRKELQEKERYSFSVHQFNKEGEKCLKNYTFFYLNKFFDIIVSTVEDITEKFEQDILTGGYNRQGFIRHVERILKESEDRTGYAVVFFDIKNFKAVNELFGTEIGDMMLRKVYEDVRKSELKPLVSAREDADHFICLVERKNLNLDMLTGMCQKKLTRGGKTLHLSVKCGIFMLEKKKMSVNGMIDRAKIAQRYITDEFVQSYKIYDSSMKNTYIDKATLAGELEEGIEKGQFKVYFQPVVDVKTGKIASAESLIRWFHPQKGFISPGVFIPALEDSGHISELDLYVLDSVNEFQKKRYQSDKITVPVSTNLSWMDFYDEKIMNWLEKKCADVSMPSGLSRMEITETSYAAIEADRSATLEALREAGILLLLDDFGSGYSSFGMLQNYNFDIMKIDMSFVRQIETNTKTRSIIRFIIEMAHTMDIKIIAEGAETKEQVEFLRDNGCDYIQGYYFYKPMPEEEFVKLLDAGR